MKWEGCGTSSAWWWVGGSLGGSGQEGVGSSFGQENGEKSHLVLSLVLVGHLKLLRRPQPVRF